MTENTSVTTQGGTENRKRADPKQQIQNNEDNPVVNISLENSNVNNNNNNKGNLHQNGVLDSENRKFGNDEDVGAERRLQSETKSQHHNRADQLEHEQEKEIKTAGDDDDKKSRIEKIRKSHLIEEESMPSSSSGITTTKVMSTAMATTKITPSTTITTTSAVVTEHTTAGIAATESTINSDVNVISENHLSPEVHSDPGQQQTHQKHLRNGNKNSSSASDSDADEVGRLFEEKPEAFEKWLKERAPQEVIGKLHDYIESRKPIRSPKRVSVTSDLFQQWLLSSPVKKCRSPSSNSIGCRRHLQDLDEGELFMELIRDVANELDIDVLCHKILVNVGLLTHADRGSLFLAKGPPGNRYLTAKLFDVTQTTALSDAVKKARAEELIIPFGVGIAGAVAESKEIINIKEAYKDSRFNCEIDQKTGYKTNAILCMPICNYEEDVIGVAQIINKTNGSEFTDHDVEVFRRYLTFCGIGIQNAQLFEMSVQEYRRNQILLNLARSIFEEQNNLECLVTKIMTEARELLKCERCAVFLVDPDCCESSHLERIIEKPNLVRRISNNPATSTEETVENKPKPRPRFTVLFELGAENQSANVSRPSTNDLNCSTLAQIALCVATTGQTLNIPDVRDWVKEHNQIQSDGEIDCTKAILCMPIVNAQKNVLGVAQLINKGNELPFTDSDVSIFEAFAIFCGLGIHNTQMYENACKLMAKQKVALECLSYHATASQDQTAKLVSDRIPSADAYNLYSFTFIDFDLDDDDTCKAAVRMFLQCNLVQQFHIPYDVLCRWVLSVRKNYRPVKYHNWRHALNVAQTMFAMLKTGKMERFMTDLEILGLLVACFCHDLDHRGTNNAFQTKTESPLAILYSTSTMEHHHFDQCVMILNSEGNNIFQELSPDDYRRVMKVVENAILSTDLAMYFKKRNSFLELVDNGEFDWQSEEKKELLCGMMMTACDVSAIAKPWEVQHRVAKLVADEFFDQGDLEKLQLNTQPVAMMDRERKDELPKMQVGFIDVICLPLYKVLCDTFPWITPLYEGTYENRNHWQDLAEKVEMGLTWIDHDTIDKPVEEFAACTEEIKDIEFTVTTLNCQHNDNADHTSPEHHRARYSSIKKTGALAKAVRTRLSKSLYGSMDGKKTTKIVENSDENKKSTKIPENSAEEKYQKEVNAVSEPGGTGGAGESMTGTTKTIPTSLSTTAIGSTATSKPVKGAEIPSPGQKLEKPKKRSKLCSIL